MPRTRTRRAALRRGEGRAPDIDQLIAQAKALGIRANKRWSAETLIAKIAAKEKANGQTEKDDKKAGKPKAGDTGTAPAKGRVRKSRKKGRRKNPQG